MTVIVPLVNPLPDTVRVEVPTLRPWIEIAWTFPEPVTFGSVSEAVPTVVVLVEMTATAGLLLVTV